MDKKTSGLEKERSWNNQGGQYRLHTHTHTDSLRLLLTFWHRNMCCCCNKKKILTKKVKKKRYSGKLIYVVTTTRPGSHNEVIKKDCTCCYVRSHAGCAGADQRDVWSGISVGIVLHGRSLPYLGSTVVVREK